MSLIIGYGIGTSVLQSAYQKGDVLTAACTATMVTNAVPIVAPLVLFGETLPHGIRAVAQIAAFTCPHRQRGLPGPQGRAERSPGPTLPPPAPSQPWGKPARLASASGGGWQA